MEYGIIPGRPWFDSRGDRIQAHGGSIIEVDGRYYFYGENKENTVPGSGVWHNGVNCYSSKDLINWTFENTILKAADDERDIPCIRPESWTGHISFTMKKIKNMSCG